MQATCKLPLPAGPRPTPQRSALQVAAFQGPAASSTDSSVGVPSNATGSGGSSAPSNGTSGGDSGPRASASQLASVYVLPRALLLSQLAAMDGQILQTRAGDLWQLRVHATLSAMPGVSAPSNAACEFDCARRCVPCQLRQLHCCACLSCPSVSSQLCFDPSPASPSLRALQGPPAVTLTLGGTNTSASIIDDLSTCQNRTAGARCQCMQCMCKQCAMLQLAGW